MINIGVAGCGASVWMHGPALARQDDARVVAWMDPQREAAEKAVAQYGGTAYTDYAALLAHPGLDAVIIASPSWLHVEQATLAAHAGKHVLCEKPMARTVAECQQIIDACRDVILMVAFMKRFDPALCQAQEMIAAGELGEIFEISSEWSWPQYVLGGWRDSRQTLGGLFQDHGSHTLDLCRWWAGDITSVYADVQMRLIGREVEDFAHVVCRHAGGCVSIHHQTRLTHQRLHENYRIEGSKATLALTCHNQWSATQMQPFTMTLYRNAGGISSSAQDITPQTSWANFDRQLQEEYRYTRQLRYFVTCVREQRQPAFCRGVDGLAAIAGINAAYLSSAENRVIPLPLTEPVDLNAVFDRLAAQRHRFDAQGDVMPT